MPRPRRSDPRSPVTVPSGSRPGGLRRVFGAFPTGVTAVAGLAEGSPLGIAASSFTSVSLDPPVVSVCTAHSSTTWPRLRHIPRVGISVLGAHQEDACRRLGGRGDDRGGKFATLRWRATEGGAVFVEGASAWLECSVYREVTVGDRDIVLLLVRGSPATRRSRRWSSRGTGSTGSSPEGAAAMTVEFISLINVWESSELYPPSRWGAGRPRTSGGTRAAWRTAGSTTRWSPTTPPATTRSPCRPRSQPDHRIKPIVALRPNTMQADRRRAEPGDARPAQRRPRGGAHHHRRRRRRAAP